MLPRLLCVFATKDARHSKKCDRLNWRSNFLGCIKKRLLRLLAQVLSTKNILRNGSAVAELNKAALTDIIKRNQ